MKETISRVEKRSDELQSDQNSVKTDGIASHTVALEDAVSSSKDRLIHQTYEVPDGPIFPIMSIPETVSSTQGDALVTVQVPPKAENRIQELDRVANVLTPEVDTKIKIEE
jgi:hypothetical protein